MLTVPGWRNRQTRGSQKPVAARPYRFDSDSRHLPETDAQDGFRLDAEELAFSRRARPNEETLTIVRPFACSRVISPRSLVSSQTGR